MAIRTVVTRGFGNGTFNGTIPLVVTRGYTIGAAIVLQASDQNIAFLVMKNRVQVAPQKERVKIAPIKERVKTS